MDITKEQEELPERVPERFIVSKIIIKKKPVNSSQQNSSYLQEAADYLLLQDVAMKFNRQGKCKRGTYDDTFKCGNEEPNNDKKLLSNSMITKNFDVSVNNIESSTAFNNIFKLYKSGREVLGPEDKKAEEFAKQLGLNANKPNLISREEMNRREKSGELIAFRGTEQAYAKQMKTGDMFIGAGAIGSGIYAAINDVDRAKEYASKETGTVMKIAISKDAKIVQLSNIRNQQISFLEKLESQMYLSTNTEEKNDKLSLMYNILSDPGKFAMLKGYDAIQLNKGPKSNTLVIINRKIMNIEDEYSPEG